MANSSSRNRRLNLKPPRNEMPSPGDPRLKAYEQQREMDRQALLLIGMGLPIQEAYRSVLSDNGLAGARPKGPA